MRLFIVDRSAIVRERLQIYLAAVEGVELIGAVANAGSNVNGLSLQEADAVLLSINRDARNELQLVRRLKKRILAPIVVVLTNSPSIESKAEFTLTGADHFLDKTFEFERIPEVLGLALQGRV